MLREVLLQLAERSDVRDFIVTHRATRDLARRFVAGETLDDALHATRSLSAKGVRAILNHLGERVASLEEARRAAEDYRRLIERLHAEGLEAHVAVKLTQLGLDHGVDACAHHLEAMVAAAAEVGSFVAIDMENSRYTQATLDLFETVCRRHPTHVGVCVQAYLHRTARDVERLLRLGARVRLCKGAYLEPPAVALQRKEDVDEQFRRPMALLIERGACPAIATHDERLIAEAKLLARAFKRSADSFEFQMLYGVRRDLQQALRRAGYRVRVYVPYGREWYPYLTRRLAERPANLLFLMRALWAESRRNGRSAA